MVRWCLFLAIALGASACAPLALEPVEAIQLDERSGAFSGLTVDPRTHDVFIMSGNTLARVHFASATLLDPTTVRPPRADPPSLVGVDDGRSSTLRVATGFRDLAALGDGRFALARGDQVAQLDRSNDTVEPFFCVLPPPHQEEPSLVDQVIAEIPRREPPQRLVRFNDGVATDFARGRIFAAPTFAGDTVVAELASYRLSDGELLDLRPLDLDEVPNAMAFDPFTTSVALFSENRAVLFDTSGERRLEVSLNGVAEVRGASYDDERDVWIVLDDLGVIATYELDALR